MNLSEPLKDFFQEQKARYGELFWFEQDDQGKIILMLEKLAQKAREILAATASNAATAGASPALENQNLEVVSFEQDDSIGDFYVVEAEQIDLEQRPSKQEYESVTDEKLETVFTDLTNDIYQDQIVRVYSPSQISQSETSEGKPTGYQDYCVVVYHSFGKEIPCGPIGWLKNLEGLGKIDFKTAQELLRQPTNKSAPVSDLGTICKKFEGVKYTLGGGSFKNGFDCSGLVQRIFFETKGIWLPRKARWQKLACEEIKIEDLKQGDLVFFEKASVEENDGIDHVALVLSSQVSQSEIWEGKSQSGKLPQVFHAKKIYGKALFEDLNQSEWLWRENNQQGRWRVESFARVKNI